LEGKSKVSEQIEIRVPDIGDFDAVPVIELLVSAGDTVAAEQSLITLESDKATMEVPSPAAGTIVELKVDLDDKVKQGDVLALLEVSDSTATVTAEPTPVESEPAPKTPQQKMPEKQPEKQEFYTDRQLP
jgi:pyruvate/2-oxoglutarate dehydrogenase complex dihydrolipoamide acyltransferase (E2) component